MSFLATLNDAVLQGEALQQVQMQRAAHKVLEEFKAECHQRALRCETSCIVRKSQYFHPENEGSFSNGWNMLQDFQERFIVMLRAAVLATFSKHSSVTPWISGFELHARWPKPSVETCTRPQSPRSNVIRDCCVCMGSGPVVALTPCGHLVCTTCSSRFARGSECPICRQSVCGYQNLFG
mmetsp:Transcript_20439/g.56718  ORF Transcript_20439/g.56718 Transcript_20439/m.56718 type:complete len:180 (-) Transcript_20439:301-840(-)